MISLPFGEMSMTHWQLDLSLVLAYKEADTWISNQLTTDIGWSIHCVFNVFLKHGDSDGGELPVRKQWLIRWKMDNCAMFTACEFPFALWWPHSFDDSPRQSVKGYLPIIRFYTHTICVETLWDLVTVTHPDIYRNTDRKLLKKLI